LGAARRLISNVDRPAPVAPRILFLKGLEVMMKTLSWLFVGALMVSCFAQSAQARPGYKTVLDAEAKGKKIESVTSELKCNFCHVDKEAKKVRNAYGMALIKCGLSEEKYNELKGDKAKLADFVKGAMKKAEALKAPCGSTFGDLIKAGKAPCTTP
jgi:hypothetical protein